MNLKLIFIQLFSLRYSYTQRRKFSDGWCFNGSDDVKYKTDLNLVFIRSTKKYYMGGIVDANLTEHASWCTKRRT